MNYKKLCVIAAIVAAVAGMSAGYYFRLASRTASKKPSEDYLYESSQKSTQKTDAENVSANADTVYEEADTDEEKEPKEGGYVLREYLGRIGVYGIYGQGREELINIIDVGVEKLPGKDREQLQEGIYATSHEELLQIIEDYTS